MEIIAITNQLSTPIGKYLLFIKSLIKAEVNWVQVRGKTCASSTPLELSEKIKPLIQGTKTKLMINDDLSLAKQIDADGLHIGQSDISINTARTHWKKTLGVTVESLEQIKETNNYDVDYIAVSSVFHTNSKNNIKKIWEKEGLLKAKELSRHRVVAIGGISNANINEILPIQIDGIAIIEALHSSPNPQDYILKTKQLIRSYYAKNTK